MMSEAEREYLERHGPAKHAATARLIDALITAADMLPCDHCLCDEDRCKRHQAIDAIVEHAVKRGRDWRARVRWFCGWRRK